MLSAQGRVFSCHLVPSLSDGFEAKIRLVDFNKFYCNLKVTRGGHEFRHESTGTRARGTKARVLDMLVFCVVHEKLSIIESRQCVFSFEKPKPIDCFLLSTTVFSQLLIDNFDDTQQNLGSMTKRHRQKQLSITFCLSVDSLIPVRSAASNDPNLITQKCFFPRGWNSFKSTIINNH